MSEKTCKTVRLSFSIVLAAMTVIVGALFIWQVLDLYFTGVNAGNVIIYTPEDVKFRVNRISPAFWLWVALIVVGFVIWEVFTVKQKRLALKDDCYALMRLKKRIPATAEGELATSLDFIKREEKKVRTLRIILAVAIAISVIFTIVYLAIPSNFPAENVTHEVLEMVKYLSPFIGCVLICAVNYFIVAASSAKVQLPHAKKLAAGNKPVEKVHEGWYGKVLEVIHHKYFLLGVRIAVGVIAVSFIIAGICNGNMSRILEKAINICMECIGLG